MAIPLDKLVGQKMDAYRGNPQALQQRHQQNQQLLDLLALQKLKTEKDAARNSLALAQKQNPGTIAEQLEREHLEGTKRDMVEQAGGVMQNRQAQEQNNLRRAAQGATPPPNVANTGIAAAPRTPMRMAQGGVIGFQRGKEVNVPPDEILERMGLTREKWLGLTEEMQGAYLKEFPAISPDASGLRRDITKVGDYFDRLGLEQARAREAQRQTPEFKGAASQRFGRYVFGDGDAPTGAEEDKVGKGQQLPSAVGEAPETQAEFMVPGVPDPGEQPAVQAAPHSDPYATIPKTPPVVDSFAAKVGTAGKVRRDPNIQTALKSIAESGAPEGTGIYGNPPQGTTIPTSTLHDETTGLARGQAERKPWEEFAKWGKQGLAALGRPPEVRQREKQRQAAAANLFAQHYDPNKLRGERLSRFLSEGARADSLGAASAGLQQLKQEQEAATRKGVEGLFKTERADEALDTTVREQVFNAAKTAHEKANENIAKGITAMAGLSRDEQNRLSAEVKLIVESGDRQANMKLQAVMSLATLNMRAEVANLQAETAKQDRILEAAVEKAKSKRMEKKDINDLLHRNQKLMTDARAKMEEIHADEKWKLTDREYQKANPEGKAAIEKARQIKNQAILANVIDGIPERQRKLEAMLQRLTLTGFKRKN